MSAQTKREAKAQRSSLNVMASVDAVEFLREDKTKIPIVRLGEPVDRIRYYRMTASTDVFHYATYWSDSGKLLSFEAILE